MQVCAKDYAELTGLPVRYIRRLCRQGILPHVKVGKRYYFERADADALLEAKREASINQFARMDFLGGVREMKKLTSVKYRRQVGLPV